MKKIIYSLLFVFLLVIFPKTTFAVTDITVFLDEGIHEYWIFPSDGWSSCEYFITDDAAYSTSISPVYYTCDTVIKNSISYPVVKIPEANIGDPDVEYLWFSDGSMFELRPSPTTRFQSALTTSEVEFLGSETDLIGTTKRIKTVIGNTDDYGYIDITDTNFDSYAYLIFKVDATNPLEDALYTAFSKLDAASMAGYDPYTAVKLMIEFRNLYNSTLDTRKLNTWNPLASDKRIKEPDEAKAGDTYIVWIRGDFRGAYTYDIQVMTCGRRDWRNEDIIERLPHTGMDLFLEGLLAVNTVLIPTIYFKKRKLEKIK